MPRRRSNQNKVLPKPLQPGVGNFQHWGRRLNEIFSDEPTSSSQSSHPTTGGSDQSDFQFIEYQPDDSSDIDESSSAQHSSRAIQPRSRSSTDDHTRLTRRRTSRRTRHENVHPVSKDSEAEGSQPPISNDTSASSASPPNTLQRLPRRGMIDSDNLNYDSFYRSPQVRMTPASEFFPISAPEGGIQQAELSRPMSRPSIHPSVHDLESFSPGRDSFSSVNSTHSGCVPSFAHNQGHFDDASNATYLHNISNPPSGYGFPTPTHSAAPLSPHSIAHASSSSFYAMPQCLDSNPSQNLNGGIDSDRYSSGFYQSSSGNYLPPSQPPVPSVISPYEDPNLFAPQMGAPSFQTTSSSFTNMTTGYVSTFGDNANVQDTFGMNYRTVPRSHTVSYQSPDLAQRGGYDSTAQRSRCAYAAPSTPYRGYTSHPSHATTSSSMAHLNSVQPHQEPGPGSYNQADWYIRGRN